MKLYQKSFLVVGVSLVSFTAVVYFLVHVFIKDRIDDYETEIVTIHAQRVESAIHTLFQELDRQVLSWAYWDDTYQFVHDTNAAYVASNMTRLLGGVKNPDFVLFVNESNEPVFYRHHDPVQGEDTQLPETFRVRLPQIRDFAGKRHVRGASAGFIVMGNRIAAIGVRQILRSDRGGAPRGFLVMGHCWEGHPNELLSGLKDVPISWIPSGGASRHFEDDVAASLTSNDVVVRVEGHNTLSAYTAFRDIFGSPVVVARTSIPRELHERAMAGLYFFLGILWAGGLTYGLVSVWTLRVIALSRLSRLSRDMHRIREQGNATTRVHVEGNDELTDLASDINEMLASIGDANSSLRASDLRYKQLFDNMMTGNYISTPDGQIVLCNEAFARIMGYSSVEEAMSVSASRLYGSTEERDQFIRALREARRLEGFEGQLVRADGSLIHVVENVIGIFNERNELIQLQGHLLDVTARRAAELALRQSEVRFRNIVENSNDAIIVHQNGKVIMVNRTFEELTGYSREEMSSASLDQLIMLPEESRRIILSRMKREMNGESLPKHFAFRVITKAGALREFEAGNTTIDWDGDVARLTVMRDVTEQKTLEASFHHAQRMESVGRLAGGVAHDFNNLLSAIIGHAELALLRAGAEDPLKPAVSEILRTADRASNLTRQLLAFSRRQVISPEAIDLNLTIAGMSRMLRRIIGEDIELVMLPEEHLWPVMADPGQIEQVILNLAVNARDAMPDGGKLVITTRNVAGESSRQESPSAGSHVLLTVEDTGVGMSDDVKAKIFEPFYTTKPVGVGTGLGLSTVYGIVSQAGGSIDAESRLGAGTTFRVCLPRARTDSALVERPSQPPDLIFGNETVLVVEDNDAVRDVAVQGLQRFGYKTLNARTAEEALILCRDLPEPVDLVLTDMIMPGMNGQQFAAQLREMWPTVKIILMSGYIGDTVVMDDDTPFIQKPLRPHVLALKLREVLDS